MDGRGSGMDPIEPNGRRYLDVWKLWCDLAAGESADSECGIRLFLYVAS